MTESITSGLDRDQALRSIGLDPSIISRSPGRNQTLELPVSARKFEIERLEDDEWTVIMASGLLPADPPQFGSMTTRWVLEALITVVSCGRSWTYLDHAGLSSEAVRKKFTRCATKGTWQALAAQADNLGLSNERKMQLKSIGARAQQTVQR